MKKPWAVYLLVGFYGLSLLIIALMFFHVRSDLHGHRFWYSPWAWMGGFKEKLILSLIAVLPASAMIGIWRGKAWGRNLSLAICAFTIIAEGFYLAQIFTTLEPEKFTGQSLFAKIFNGSVFLVFIIVFYLALRPEVGRYCRIYPRDG